MSSIVRSGSTLRAAGVSGLDIHPTALIDDHAELGEDVRVGPFSVIGPGVVVGSGTRIGSHVVIERDTRMGSGCVVATGAVLGSNPQDMKYNGEQTCLEVGDRTVIREYATLNRGTVATGRTVVGSDCMLMAYVHVAHDCRLGNHVILSNSVNMAGHVCIGDWANISGLTPIHQFVRIGAHAFVGGASRVVKDIPPFVKAAGNPVELYGLNSVGLKRRGFSDETRRELKRAYRLFYNSAANTSQALTRGRDELGDTPEVRLFMQFFEDSDRGVSG